MPELPEVETIVRALNDGGRGAAALPGRTVQTVRVLWQRTTVVPEPDLWSDRLEGQNLISVHRRGKFVLLQFQLDTVLFHLRMSGDLRVEPQAEPVLPHDRLMITFTDGFRLVFNDTRKFGRAWLTGKPEDILGKLGPEPLEDTFTPEWLYAALRKRNRQLKPLLLDQSFIAGLGNIYTDEALHAARLHPLRLSSSITQPEATALCSAIRAVLMEGIRRNGASIDWVYRGGDFQNYFQVYGRKGLPCLTCGMPITRLLVGQRGTHVCETCQH